MTAWVGIALSAVASPCPVAPVMAAGPASAMLTVRAVRHWAAPGCTRVVLDMSGEPRYRVRALADPYRVVIEIPACQFSRGVVAQNVADGVLDRIRVARAHSEADVILDVPRETPYAHFVLPPRAGKPYRIVVDLKNTLPGAEPAPNPVGAGSPKEAPQSSGIRKPAVKSDITVVIDPGHGGNKPGKTLRSGVQEKTLTLKLARLLKAEIERHAGFRAVLVREGDYDVQWYQRIVFARDHGGDCFVSLHFNANKDWQVRGIELYFLSLEGATDENAEAVAEQENLMLEVGQDARTFNDDLKSMLFEVSQTNAMQQSSLLAESVADAIREDAPIPFRKVKQANFIVLRGIAMPSILVEGGYLSNRSDAASIERDSYLRWLARALAEGITGYFGKYPPADRGPAPE